MVEIDRHERDCTRLPSLAGRGDTSVVVGFTIVPRGPFSLAAARDFAGGFAAGIGARGHGAGILMVFPVEGWQGSSAVDCWQDEDGTIRAEVSGTGDMATVERQAARSLSLDHDGGGWPEVGRRDPIVGALQERFGFLRPVCFYSAYEAATSFVIGQRIAMRQARVVKERLATAIGDEIRIDGQVVRPFPRPQALAELGAVQGLSSSKVDRLRAIGRAALDGRLDTERLRGLAEADALAELQSLPGIGPWTAQAVLLRGCGVADALPLGDNISRTAVQWFHQLPEPPDDAAWQRIAEPWRPYRMWATVLMHMAWRRDQPSPPSYRHT
jgi:DNA-3-methyladenine glycosylase II